MRISFVFQILDTVLVSIYEYRGDDGVYNFLW